MTPDDFVPATTLFGKLGTKPADRIGEAQLAKMLGMSSAGLRCLANEAQLPFAVSTEHGLTIHPLDAAAWLAAARHRGQFNHPEPNKRGI
jgi:hypothetical protein